MESSRFTYSIKTMGCKANIYDSLVLEHELTEIGGVQNEESPDLFILNSCTVTDNADKQAIREVALARKKNADSWTMVTGCYAHVAEEKVKSLIGVDAVVTNDKKHTLKKLVADHFSIELKNESSFEEEMYWGQLPTFRGRMRSFLKIQEGCNDFCTYCIIPYARGKSRSVKMESVLAEINRLVDLGINEVILTGINIADYGMEFGSTLDDLIENILLRTKIKRLRLTSLDPTEITDRLLSMMKSNPRLMPHFHVSLQSPVSRVLRAMKRKYRREEVIECLNKIHAQDSKIFVGMDLITGFPSETKEEHKEAVQTLKDLPWTRLHVFPYSERQGTPALKLSGSVPMSERKDRAKEMMELSKLRHQKWANQYIGNTVQEVLFESIHEAGGDFFLIGHSNNYNRVMTRVPSRNREDAVSRLNTVHTVKVCGAIPKPMQDWTLEAYLGDSNAPA